MAQLQNLPQSHLEQAPVLCDTRRPTLLKKYDIPINYLDFDYIKICRDGRELEKIYHVLLSGEEGYFPDLLKCAEEKLKELMPKSKYLRKSVPVLTKQTLGKDEWNSITNDIGDWIENVSKNDKELSSLKCKPTANHTEIRQTVNATETEKSKMSNENRIKSTDYASWDKYDPDTEILKLELEEKRVKEEAKRSNKSSVNKKPKKNVKIQEPVTNAEAVFQAASEKDKGNEFFKAGEFEVALEHYSSSIIWHPTAAAYNNRALTYIKLKNYASALNDCSETLQREPNNVKGLIRRAQAYEALDYFHDALRSVEKAITVDPNNCLVQNMANSLRKKCHKVQFEKSRMLIHDIEESIKAEEKQKGGIESRKEDEYKAIVVSDKYNKPTSKERRKSLIPVRNNNETVILPIPGTSRSSPPFYKVVKRNSINEEIKRINNRPRILHIPTIYQENTDDEDNADFPSPVPGNDSLPELPFSTINCKIEEEESLNVKITEIIEKFAKGTLPFEAFNNNNDCCKNGNRIGMQISENSEFRRPKEFEVQIDKNYPKSIKDPQEKSLQSGTETKDFLANNFKAKISPSISFQSHKTAQKDLGAGGDTGRPEGRDSEVPQVVESPYSFLRAWSAISRDLSYRQHAEVLENMEIGRFVEVIGCKLDGDMLSGIIRCMFRHFTVPDKVDRVAEILKALVRLPRFDIALMFLNKDDSVALEKLVEFLEQHGRFLPRELKDNLLGF